MRLLRLVNWNDGLPKPTAARQAGSLGAGVADQAKPTGYHRASACIFPQIAEQIRMKV